MELCYGYNIGWHVDNNNVKALDALNQELFQLRMANKETVSDWGIHLSRHHPGFSCFFPRLFSPWLSGRVKERPLLWWTPQACKSIGGLPEGRSTGKDLLWLPKGCPGGRERRFYGAAQRPYSPDYQQCSKTVSYQFLPLWKLKGNQPTSKTPAVCLAHLEEDDDGRDEDEESNNPSGIEGVTKEFMVHLARVVKDAQGEETCCYHCSSPEHFIHNCPLIKTLRENTQLNGKEGTVSKKGAWTPLAMVSTPKNLQMEVPKV